MAKILIVEDDEEIAMLERDYLEIEGFQAQEILRRRGRGGGAPPSPGPTI